MDRRMFLGPLASGLLAAPLAAEAQTPPFFPFLLVAGVVFLLCTGVLLFVSSRRRRRKLVKMLVTLVAGSVCGAFWILLIDTAVNPAIPDAMNEPAVLVVGVVTALVAVSLLSMANHLSEMVGLSAIAMGFHSLALPIAALISIVAGGAHAVDLRAVALSIGGLLVGVVLVIVGDRVLRRRRMRSSKARFDLGRPPA
jgi:dipeptide/tripeptide permease